MNRRGVAAALSRRAPAIVFFSLAVALAAYWGDAPLSIPYGLAGLVAISAIIVMAARDRASQIEPTDDAGADTERSGWLAQELAGNGSPPGSYLLGFCALVVIAITGFRGAYALPAWAALGLAAAWGLANARYPIADDGTNPD